jgi:2-polyprenyl-3-methyl-5-hydroxy-6-metoxy-1,4-benzoquinol methylase
VNDASNEIESGDRFSFGENWAGFLSLLNDDRIRMAEESLTTHLGNLEGKKFLDIGSGSGLFSLAARNLGAEVTSFDFDESSVACTRELKRRFYTNDEQWRIEQGGVTDNDYVASLGAFDLVYSWGVLHHTGDMWHALENVSHLVAPGGKLFISIYNDQGLNSRVWLRIKRTYNAGGAIRRQVLVTGVGVFFRTRSWAQQILGEIYRTATSKPRQRTNEAGRARGMDRRHDLIDWVGGFPFEVAKPEQIFDFYRSRGYSLIALKTCGGGLGCNEFVMTRDVD